MEQKLIFRERLTELLELASSQNDTLSAGQIREFFSSMPLEEAHLKSLFDYLREKGIRVDRDPGEEAEDEIEGKTDILSYYIDDLDRLCRSAVEAVQNGTPVMEPEKEWKLFRAAAQGDRDAADLLTRAYLPIVCQIVEEYGCEDLPQEDLIQEGNMGLWNALFELENTDSLAACQAQVWSRIHEAMRSAVARARGWKDSDHQVEDRVNRLRDAAEALKEELGNYVSAEELSAYLDMPLEEIEAILRLIDGKS